jgi:hypothetical protein
MKLINRGQIALPLMAILAGSLLAMARFDLIHIAHFRDLWPIAFIAFGLEDLYVWTIPGRGRIPGKDR